MVAATEVDSVNIHATVISPIVSQGQNQLHVGCFSGLNNNIELAKINLDSAIWIEHLHSSVFSPCTVLRKTASHICFVLVVESPSADDLETSVFCSLQTDFDILVVVCSPLRKSVSRIGISGWSTHDVEGEVVRITTSEEKVFAVKRELGAVSGNETSGHSKCWRASKGRRDDGSQLHTVG